MIDLNKLQEITEKLNRSKLLKGMAYDVLNTFIEQQKKQLNLHDVGSSNSIKETVKNFADIDMFLNDVNNEPFDKNDKGLGKVSRIANKYIIKLR